MFTPAASGTRTAALSAADSATGSPQSVTLSGTGTHDVILTWDASPTSGIAGYFVYRGTTPGGESSVPLNSTPVNATSYTDANVTAGSAYYYVVTAVAADGSTQSASSNEASATVPSP
jgi:titin